MLPEDDHLFWHTEQIRKLLDVLVRHTFTPTVAALNLGDQRVADTDDRSDRSARHADFFTMEFNWMAHVNHIVTKRDIVQYVSWSCDITNCDVIADMETLGQRLARIRESRGLNQTALATRCGWSGYTRISNYEKDLRIPSLEDIAKMAEQLNVSPGELAFGPDANKTKQNVAQFETDGPVRTMILPHDLMPLIEDIITAWKTNTVTRRQIYALQQTIRANANMESLPGYQEPRAPGIKKSAASTLQQRLDDEKTNH